MANLKQTIVIGPFLILLAFMPFFANAAGQANLLLSPARGSFIVGSTFDVSMVLDTNEAVNTIEIELLFPPDKLQIVDPSVGQSIIQLWPAPPTFSNREGKMYFVGGIPSPGIITSQGVVLTVTFRAIAPGRAIIKFLPKSKVLANDGLGTDIIGDFGTGIYDLNPRPPAGPRVFSETHVFESKWYNNNNPVISWEKDRGVTDFSYVLNDNPGTVPDNTSDFQETTISFEDLADGLWYFHIKAKKSGVWGGTTHFLVRIDATPPARFKPTTEVFSGAVLRRVLVSFFTTDAASGIDHYEVAAIKEADTVGGSPVFIEAQSPYQISKSVQGSVRVIVRAVDKAGNVRDEHINARVQATFLSFLANNLLILLLIVLGLVSLFSTKHFLFGHRILARIKLIWRILTNKDDSLK